MGIDNSLFPFFFVLKCLKLKFFEYCRYLFENSIKKVWKKTKMW